MITYVAVCYGYWGRGSTPEEALKQLRKAGGSKKDKTTLYCNEHEPKQDKPFVDVYGNINYHGTLTKVE